MSNSSPRVVQWTDSDLDAEFVFDRDIGADSTLDELQRVLADIAPVWASTLRVWRAPRDHRRVSDGPAESLRDVVLKAVGERGRLYQRLVARYGRPQFDRCHGSAELRGRSRNLTVVISVDELVASPLGSRLSLGNSITLQVRGARVDGRESSDWLEAVFLDLGARLSPAWASARAVAEYWAKVMTTDDRVEAVGRDFARNLPGLFWLNYFGSRYTEFIGRQRLLSTPGVITAPLEGGITVKFGNGPTDWNSESHAEAERLALGHLGVELFFAKSNPTRTGRAPRWTA